MTLTNDDKRNVLRRFSAEVFVQGNMETLEELISPDFVDHDPLPGIAANREGLKEVVHTFRGAFPDFEVELRHTVVEDDKAVDHIWSTGTHLGEFMGVPATGTRITASALVISYLDRQGRIAERWQRFSGLQLLQQLGVVPGYEEPPASPPAPDADPAATSPDENKALMTSQLAIWNDGQYDLADELFHPESVTPDAPQLPPGPEGCKQVARVFRDAFPDFRMTVEDVVAENDLVVCRFNQTGTHEGDLFGIPPTGKPVEFGEIALCQFGGGQIVSTWFQTDMLTLMSQLGVGGEAPVPA